MTAPISEKEPVSFERVRLFSLELPLRHSFQTSSHRKSGVEHILVELTDSDGAIGWGEIASPSDPYFCAETTDTAWQIATRYLAPVVLNTAEASAATDHPREVEAGWARIRGHEFAKAGFSGAVWDLFAKRRGLSLAHALGGVRRTVIAGVSLGIEASIDELLRQVAVHLDAGYPRVKLKIAPGWETEPIRAVRSAFPDLDLHVDANGAYASSSESHELFRSLDRYRLTMIEQPFGVREFGAHAELQRLIATPICLDESIVDLGDLDTMLRLDAARILNIKVSRMGGLTQAQQAHDVAERAGIPVWCGGMHEFGIGRAANVAISSLSNFVLPSDVSGSDKYYDRDIVEPPVLANGGIVEVPLAPGIGHSVDVRRLEREATRTFDSAAVLAHGA